jgi:hypothetical protein
MTSLYNKFVNYQKKKETNKGLLKGCLVNNLTLVNECLQKDHDINYKNCNGFNAYLACCIGGNLEILKKLEEHNINTKIINNQSENAYLVAVKHNNINLLSHLESTSINTNKLNRYGENAYIIASKYGHVDILKHLDQNNIVDKYHKNYNGDDAFTIHKVNVLYPTDPKFNIIRKSIIYLASIGFNASFSGTMDYIADAYYQLYYKLTPQTYKLPNPDSKCELCQKHLLHNQLILICGHKHMVHINCYVYSRYKEDRGYRWYNNFKGRMDNCIICNEPYLLRQSNIRKIKKKKFDN